MISPADLRTYVIRPTLLRINLGGDAAEELLLGTALQESKGGFYLAQINGPARGVWEMEVATHDDIQKNFLPVHRDLANAVNSLKLPGLLDVTQLCGNLYYACAMARLVYYRAPEPLPAAGDLQGQAELYKLRYNSPKGAATVEEYIANWRSAFPSTT